MRPHCLAFSVLLALTVNSPALADKPIHPRAIRVTLPASVPISALVEAGLDVVTVEGPSVALVYEWPGDQSIVARLGARSELVDEDPGRSAASRANAERAGNRPPPPKRVESATRDDGRFRPESLPAFGAGSFGGYHTIAEIKTALDDLVASDTRGLVADKIDTLGWSWQGRPIWGLALGKGAPNPGGKPVAFLNALTHAREPIGMELAIYFANDLLSAYGRDPFATYLLDRRMIYLVPLVNPDGYYENQKTYFSTGGTSFGQWRKNTRDNNGNGVYNEIKDGVDLNRNYGYRWGKNNGGSSKSPTAGDYRGPGPFSEPETRAQRDVVVRLRPKTALSFHSFSDLLYHPWGHTDTLVTEADAFHEWSDELTRDNAYQSGGGALGLYLVNGDFGDWCYGDTQLKPAVYAWTPEIGSDADGFWPPPSRLLQIIRENLRACRIATAIAGPFVQKDGVRILEGAMNPGAPARLKVGARNLGALASATLVTGTLRALDAGIAVLSPTSHYSGLGPRTTAQPDVPFSVTLADTVTPGRPLRFEIVFTDANGLYSADTLMIPAGTPTVLASDDAMNGLGRWSSGGWGIVSGDPGHPRNYFADSPTGDYGANAAQVMAWSAPLDLSSGTHAFVEYEARWELEKNYDAVALEASLDGVSWKRIGATRTTLGSGGGTQVPATDPFYAGTRWQWRKERADLSGFSGPAGRAVRLRWQLRSNASLEFGGFSFDSFRVAVYGVGAQLSSSTVGASDRPLVASLDRPYPNPVSGAGRFAFEIPAEERARLEILDVQGRRVRLLDDGRLAAGRYLRSWDRRDDHDRRVAPGVYFARLALEDRTISRRFVVTE